MAVKRSKRKPINFRELVQFVSSKIRTPICFVMSSPGDVMELVNATDAPVTSYQMDLFQAARIRDMAERQARSVTVETHPDLWDLAPTFQTLIFAVPHGGERALKLDMIEQAYHVLAPHGILIVLSPYDKDDFFPPALKKVFGRVHVPMEGDNKVFWCQRDGERPRRRHEIDYHVRVDEQTSYKFVSRPGVFGYGFFDAGGRALTEAMELEPGQRVLDVGCGVGTNGIVAARQVGPTGFVAFADSNVRAIALAELNAQAIGLTNYQAVATHTLTEWPDASFDVVLANPPYYAHGSIVRHFVERGKALLKSGGALYLVTKQVDAVWQVVQEHFSDPELFENRGYVIFRATKN